MNQDCLLFMARQILPRLVLPQLGLPKGTAKLVQMLVLLAVIYTSQSNEPL